MKSKKNMFWVAGISGAIGGAFGAASGSNSWIVVMCVSAVIALFVAWAASGVLK